MRQLVFLALTFCVFLISEAQTSRIEGVVLNALTGSAISGAAVQEEAAMHNGTQTDSNGHFSLLVSSEFLLIQHVGFQTRRFSIGRNVQNLQIWLEETTDVMNQVVISANKTEKRLKELTMSLEILHPDLVRDKNPITMDEVINQVPGVQITDDQINIRAGSGWSYGAGSRVTVLVDGAPLMNGDAGTVLWTFMSTDHLNSIEVLKGASSVLYGSSALNGVINISTRWPGEKPTTTATLFSGGYSNAKRPGLKWTNDVLNNSGVRISDSRKIGKNDLNTSLEYLKNEGYRFGDHEERLHLGADWRRKLKSDMYVGLRTHLLVTDIGSFLLWKSYDSAYLALNDAATINDGIKFRLDPFWLYRTRNNWLFKVNTRFLRVDNNIDSGNPDVDQSNSANTYYVDYQSTSPTYFGWQAIGGVLYTRSVSTSPLFGGNHSSSNTALYTQIEKKRGRLIFNVGGRLENYRLNDFEETKPVFRTGLSFRADTATFLRASYGQGYRFPTIAESFIETKVGIVSVFPNNQLGSETGWNAEVGVKQGFKLSNLKGFIDFAIYRMKYRNMMGFAFSQWSKDISIGNGLGLGFKSVNNGRTQISGLDLSINCEWQLGNRQIIRFIGGYTFSNPISLEPHRQIATDSVGIAINYINTSSDTTDFLLKYRSKHLIKSDLHFSSERWVGGFSIRYHSFMRNIGATFVREPLSLFIPGVAEGQALNSNGTWIVDFRWFYKIQPGLRTGIVVSNVFNQEFMIRPADMGPPRLLLIQLKKEFGL